ncbi:MAG TPA: M55 family metallopeptidase [Azospirillum sp.]|nr:M55 family metallopeptidase [Azospirillum sp.]
MRIFISADIEGIAGVVSPQQTMAGNAEYERARRLMTAEVNAAVEGALAAGATEIVVNDAHGGMTNLLPEELHPEAALILGKPKPMTMFAGLDAGFAGVMCVGYHGGARRPGVLAHTTNSFAFGRITVNGRELGEAGLYGAYAGSLGVPVVLLSGDDRLAEETAPLFPGAERVIVKQALGQRAARNLSPAAAHTRLRSAAEAAARRAGRIAPFRIDGPFLLHVEMNTPALADLAAGIPVARRLDAVSVGLEADTMAGVVGWVNTLSALSAALR